MSKYKDLKVLYVGSPPLFSKGASGIHMLKMCQAMAREKIDVELLLPGYFSKTKLFRYYGIKDRFKVISIPFTDLFARQIVHGIASAVYVMFSGKKYNVILTRNLVFSYLASLFLKLPVIYDAHHPPVNNLAKNLISSFSRARSFLGMSFNTEGLRKLYQKEVIDTNCNTVVAHNGVDLTDYSIDYKVSKLRKELNLPLDKRIVSYSGNTYKGRGIENLILAAKELKDIEFLVVGGLESDNSTYRKMVSDNKLDNVNILGFVEHERVSKYLLASDILILPYTKEITIKDGSVASEFTSPIKLFEYLAAGKPIISSELPSVKEILTHDKNCLMIEPDNIEKIVEAVNLLLKDKKMYSKLSKNSLDESQNHSWENRVNIIFDKFIKYSS